MEIPKVSVVMSVYNDEAYICEAVDSILNQTFRDFEFIIINDGSTDRTREILSSYRDDRIRLFDQGNMGLTKSLNKGLSLARGEYIARMDGDDISDSARLEKEACFLDHNRDIGLVGTFAHRIDEQGKKISLYTYKTTNEEIRKNIWVDCPFCHSSVMFRKACIDTVGPYREKVGPSEDYDLWFRLTERFDTANIPEQLHCFRIDSKGITVKKRFDQLRYTMLVRLLAEERKKNGEDNLEKWSPEMISQTLDTLFPKTPQNEKAVLLDNYIYLAEIYYVTANYGRSLSWLSRYLRGYPSGLRGLKLFVKLMISILLPSALLKYIKHAANTIQTDQ